MLKKTGLVEEITRADILPHLRTPDEPHSHLNSPDLWWQALQPVVRQAFVALGIPSMQAMSLANDVREGYLSPLGWRVFEDAIPVLSALRDSGWRHVVFSNHATELPQLVQALGLDHYFDHVLSSGTPRYEKPLPEAFRGALVFLPEGSHAWMVEDSYRADVQGAETAGLPAGLVRARNPTARYQCTSLYELESIVAADDQPARTADSCVVGYPLQLQHWFSYRLASGHIEEFA